MARGRRPVGEQRERRPRNVGHGVAATGVEPVDEHRPVHAHDDVAGMQVPVAEARCVRPPRQQLECTRERGVHVRRRPADLADQPVALVRKRDRRDELEERQLDVRQRAPNLGSATRVIDDLLPERGPVDPLPDAGRAAEDLLYPEQRRCRRADRANRFDMLRLGPDPAGRGRRLRHLDDRAAAIGMDHGARSVRDYITEEYGAHPIPTRSLAGRTYHPAPDAQDAGRSRIPFSPRDNTDRTDQGWPQDPSLGPKRAESVAYRALWADRSATGPPVQCRLATE